MRSKLVVGNWKMHGSDQFCTELALGIKAGLDGIAEAVEVGVCPPSVYLSKVIESCRGSSIKIGAQNVSPHEKGAYTGEVAANMLADLGCDYVLVGHSERRELFAESNQDVAEKFAAVQAAGMLPILCVGETLEHRQQEITDQVVLAQLDAVLDRVGIAAFTQAVVAYEPVWAIGTGETASPEQAQAVHGLLREHIAKQDSECAAGLRIIYGGSVKSSNSAELFAQRDIDGGLVGGASLEAEQFIAICASAEK